MKILHVLRAPVGGLFRHVVDLAHGQIERGHAVGLIADSTAANAVSESMLAALAPKLSLGLSRVRIFRQPGPADLAAVWHVTRRIQETGAEIVHGHGAKGGALARLAPSRQAPVRAYTPHGGSLHNGVGGRVHVLMERILKPHGQLYLFESAYSSEVFRRKLGEAASPVRVVHNGVRREECEPIAPTADASDLVYLGEMRALKGVDVLIEALARLRDSGRSITATLVGDGPDAAALRAKTVALGLGEQVRFCKPMPARQALARGRVVTVPSRAESLPYVVLEAAAAGKPLIATNVGGIPEVFGPLAHRLVRPDNAEALAGAIANAVDCPAATAEAAAALRARVQAAFSVDAMVDGVISAYRQARALPQGQASRAAYPGQAAIDRRFR
jgi:glycosyltransferase involved in cell wall biosynthesis